MVHLSSRSSSLKRAELAHRTGNDQKAVVLGRREGHPQNIGWGSSSQRVMITKNPKSKGGTADISVTVIIWRAEQYNKGINCFHLVHVF